MKKIQYLYFVAAFGLTLGLASCTKTIDYYGPEVEPYAVLYSLPSADSTMDVRLTWSRFFLENEYKPDGNRAAFPKVTDATLQLRCNGEPCAAPDTTGGIYRFALRPQPGDTLSLTADIPGYTRGQLSATTVVPQPPQWDIVERYRRNSSNMASSYHSSVKMRLVDPGGKQYYHLSVISSYYPTITPHFTSAGSLGTRDPYLTDASEQLRNELQEVSRDMVSEIYFTNETFAGQTITVDLDLYNMTIEHKSTRKYGDYWFLILTTVSESYYYYATTLKAVREAEFNDLLALFSEPIRVYTNVEGGVGCLGARTVSIKPVPTE